MRVLTPAGAAILASDRAALTMLVEMRLSSTIYVTTAPIDIEHGGNTYIGARMVGVEEIKAQGGEVQGLRFSLGGVRQDSLALALAEQIQGKVCIVSVVVMDAETHAIADVMQAWAGTLDQMPISFGETAVINVTAEHRGLTFSRPRPLRYTDADQQRLHPGDKSLEFVVSQANHQDIWPSAAYGRQ